MRHYQLKMKRLKGRVESVSRSMTELLVQAPAADASVHEVVSHDAQSDAVVAVWTD